MEDKMVGDSETDRTLSGFKPRNPATRKEPAAQMRRWDHESC